MPYSQNSKIDGPSSLENDFHHVASDQGCCYSIIPNHLRLMALDQDGDSTGGFSAGRSVVGAVTGSGGWRSALWKSGAGFSEASASSGAASLPDSGRDSASVPPIGSFDSTEGSSTAVPPTTSPSAGAGWACPPNPSAPGAVAVSALSSGFAC